MVYKRSEYGQQFKVSSLKRNIPVYQENLSYRHLRRERECAHTPICWDGELTSSDSDEKVSPDEEVEKLPLSDLAITEEEEDEISKEKREAQEKDIDTKEEADDELEIVKQDNELRKSAKEKLNKYVSKENKDSPSEAKGAAVEKSSLAKTFVKPKLLNGKPGAKGPRPRRPDRQGKIPKCRPSSAPPVRQKQEIAKTGPFLAYGCGTHDKTVGEKKTFNIRASSAVYPAALRARKRNLMAIEKQQEKQRAASAREKRKKALFNEKMARETIAWDTEYRRSYPAYSNTIYQSSDKSPRRQKSPFII